MRGRWFRRLVTALSLAVFVPVAIMCVRSIWVEDCIWRNNSTEDPITPEARDYAQKHGGFEAKLIGRTEGMAAATYRGKLMLGHYRRREPMSRWDDVFEREYVNHPQWQYRAREVSLARDAWNEGSGFWDRVGFSRGTTKEPTQFDDVSRAITFPIWPIALLTAIAPGMSLRRWMRKRRRLRGGLCLACGYDLRENPQGRRCPECGMLPAAAGTMAG